MAAWSLLSNSFPGGGLPSRVAIASEGDELIVFKKWSEDRSDGKHAGYWAFDLTAKQWRQKEFRPPESVVDLSGSFARWGEELIVYPWDDSNFHVTRRCNLRTSTILEQRGQEAAEDARVHGHSGHSAVVWQDRLVVFGGYVCPTGGDWQLTNEMYSLDLTSSQWTRLPVAGEAPTPRYGHSAVLWRDQLLIFGGWTDGPNVNETWSFDLRASRWSLLRPAGAQPERRRRHSAVAAGDQMLIFGGNSIGPYLSDTWALDLPSQQWKQLSFTGAVPEKRHSHSAAMCRHGMLILGGDGNKDLWCMEFEESKKPKMEPKVVSAEPKPIKAVPSPTDAELPTPRSDLLGEALGVTTSATIKDAAEAMQALPANAEVCLGVGLACWMVRVL